MNEKYVAIDLDGCIAEYDGWQGLDYIGEPKEDAKETMERLKELGFEIIIYTCRDEEGYDRIEDYMEENNLPYDYINHNPEQPPTAGEDKVFAHYYIDDRNPGFYSILDSVKKITMVKTIEIVKRLEKIHEKELERERSKLECEKRKMQHLKEYAKMRIERCETLLEEADEDCHQGLHARISELEKLIDVAENPLLALGPHRVEIPDKDTSHKVSSSKSKEARK